GQFALASRCNEQAMPVCAVSAEEADRALAHDNRPDSFGDGVSPASHCVAVDAYQREVGVVAGPGGLAVHVERVAVGDRAPWMALVRKAPVDPQVRGEPDESSGSDRLRRVRIAPAVVAKHPFVEVANPHRAAGSGEDVLDPIPEGLLQDKRAVGVEDSGVALGSTIGAPIASGADYQYSAVGQRLHRDMGKRQVSELDHLDRIRAVVPGYPHGCGPRGSGVGEGCPTWLGRSRGQGTLAIST